MLKIRRRTMLVLGAVTLACVIAASGVALGQGSGPTLVTPKHGKFVGPGRIRMIVRSPVGPVFAQIRPQRRLNSAGHLAKCLKVKKRCQFIQLQRWRGHPGEYIYVSNGIAFPGYWATSAGREYWQAFYVNCFATEVDGCAVTSQISSFRVR